MNQSIKSIANFNPKRLRQDVLKMAYHGQSFHIGCSFSLIEVMSVLYGKILKYQAQNPSDTNRDYLVLSKGHGIMAQYACFKELGWISENEIQKYFSDGSRLHGLSESHIPGCEVTSGSLGHGLPIAVGIAKGLLLQKKSKQKVYAVVGDGELNEGTMWESILFAAHHQLENLCVIVDANDFQAMGRTQEIIALDPLADKFRAFGFETLECDGHDLEALEKNLNAFKTSAPKALIARTVKGKGVSFMENANQWHYTRIDAKTLELALQELRKDEA